MVFTATGIRQATSGDDGAFRIEDVPPGSFELKALAAATVVPGGTAQVTLE